MRLGPFSRYAAETFCTKLKARKEFRQWISHSVAVLFDKGEGPPCRRTATRLKEQLVSCLAPCGECQMLTGGIDTVVCCRHVVL